MEAAVVRDHRAALLERPPEYDEMTEQVEARLEREQVRRCLRTLTEIQHQAVTLTTSGTGESCTVNDSSKVVCGVPRNLRWHSREELARRGVCGRGSG